MEKKEMTGFQGIFFDEINKKKLIDLTFDYEFFDQAHFNLVFKEICLTPPTHYLQNLSDFYNELYKF